MQNETQCGWFLLGGRNEGVIKRCYLLKWKWVPHIGYRCFYHANHPELERTP